MINNNFLIIIIILFGLALVFYLVYYFLPKQSNVNKYGIPILSGIKTFSEEFQQIIPINTLIGNRNKFYIPYLGYGISFSWQMYIPANASNSQWQSSFNKSKPIIKIEDSPVISYNPKKNTLTTSVKYKDNPFLAKLTELNYHGVKGQTWVKYAVVVTQSSILLYENGNLVKAKLMFSPPILYDIGSKIYLGQKNNNCLCKIKDLYVYPFPLSYSEVLSL
jgi:hypothetical protein